MTHDQYHALDRKLDLLIRILKGRQEKDYLTAEEVGDMTGLDRRTVLNRSLLDPKDKHHIPYVRFAGSRRKLFERKVIERLFSIR